MQQPHKISTKITRFLSDLATPLSGYLRLREHFPESILLESADRKGGKKEFSYVCCDPIAEIKVTRDGKVHYTISTDKQAQRVDACYALETLEVPKKDYLQTALGNFLKLFEVDLKVDSSLLNGLFGFISYDAVELMEDISFSREIISSEDIPLAFYRLFRYLVVFEHQSGELYIVQNELDQEVGPDHSKNIIAIIQSAGFQLKAFSTVGEVFSNLTEAEHVELIEKCKLHIKRGDVFQIVPSRKYFQKYSGDDLNVYRALRVINPSPYLFYYKTKDFCLFGSSPEAQLQVSDRVASINPIAGTYARSGNDSEDEKSALALSKDPKEVSEHVMLVDLARNDLSIHCHPVSVARFKEIEFYSHVIHLVSKVQGKLLPEKSPLGAFCSTAPAGTLTGAPKYRAMQLLDQYEPGRRHFYGGAIGLLSFNGDINHAIMIRSFLSREGVLTTQAGSGVVAESVTANEVQEVKNKLAGLWAAVEKAKTI